MAFVAGSAFLGASATPQRAVCKKASAVRMSADGGSSDVSRRQLLLGALAAMVPAAALAKSGDSPKYSIFGGSPASSPFLYNSKEGTGKKLYTELNKEELSAFVNALKETRRRLDKDVDQAINQPNWEDIRSAIRLQMQSTRRYQMKLNEYIKEKRSADRAKDAYKEFKTSLEQLDYAATQKDQQRARKARSSAIKALERWSSVVDVDF